MRCSRLVSCSTSIAVLRLSPMGLVTVLAACVAPTPTNDQAPKVSYPASEKVTVAVTNSPPTLGAIAELVHFRPSSDDATRVVIDRSGLGHLITASLIPAPFLGRVMRFTPRSLIRARISLGLSILLIGVILYAALFGV